MLKILNECAAFIGWCTAFFFLYLFFSGQLHGVSIFGTGLGFGRLFCIY